MLYRENRLAKRVDIERVYKKGRSFFVGNLGIRLSKNSLKVSRFTIVVSTKVSKKAVDRNKLKRRIREILRKNILPNVNPGFDGVINTKKPILESTFKDLETLTIKLFKKTKLI